LAKRQYLVRQLLWHRRAELLLANITAAGPALHLGADMLRHGQVPLVPEDEIRSGFQRCVGPLLAERAVGRIVQAARRDAPSVVEHLARLRMKRHPPALGLAAERPPETPRTHLHLETELVRRRDDLRHRPAVVGEVVLRERVQHARVTARSEILQISPNVTEDADAEVRAARAQAHPRSPIASGVTEGSRRCDSSATRRYRSPR